MADFISAGAIEAGLSLPDDALDHQKLAEQLLWAAEQLPPGSVVSLQGSWGRGKTDVLARLVGASRDTSRPEPLSWLWLNPWQYGTPDLLSPLVIALIQRLPQDRRASHAALRRAAQGVVLAGLSFGLKAATRAAPGGGLLLDAAGSLNDLIGPLFAAADIEAADHAAQARLPDPDPVANMGRRFAELVDALLEEEGASRLLICVDDLDRCLPDRQVALLQAMRFLISSGAKATFVVALDPILARQALIAHYQTDAFDPDQYLDKMFTLRVNLPAIPRHRVTAMMNSHLARPGAGDQTLGEVLAAQLGAQWPAHLAEQASSVLCTPSLRNPRLLRRIVDRLYLLIAARPGAQAPGLRLHDPLEARLLIGWLALGERWPSIRAALQSEQGELARLWPLLHRRYTQDSGQQLGAAALDMLPEPTEDQRQLLSVLGGDSVTVRFIQRLEAALQAVGL
ncbi:MAG: hypothetical protein ACI8S6_001598 [Myxococcota bacterium]|jgi:hypothetical protein